MKKEIIISTKERYQLVDITEDIKEEVKSSGVEEGFVFIFTPHSTAGIILTENEEGLVKDWVNFFKKLTSGNNFFHDRIDNNADSHILSGLLGQGKTLLIEDGNIVCGTWQQIFFVELDGPRKRKIKIKIS